MKVVYLLRNRGIEQTTPLGWESGVFAAGPDGTYSVDALAEMAEADILVVGLEPINKALLSETPKVKLIQRLGKDTGNIDLKAAAAAGIPVCNMADFNSDAVAEHTLMLILALLKRVFESTLLMKAGKWASADIAAMGIFEMAGKKLGLLGYGCIGRAVAARAAPFGVDIASFDVGSSGPEGLSPQVRSVNFDRLIEDSEIISIHLPLTDETRGIVGRDEFAKMKPSAFLINTARGALVDEEALAEALTDGRLAGAALDVFSDEPPRPQHPLRRCRNVLLTPHIAGQTREAMQRMVAMMLTNFERVANNQEPFHRVS